jgi:hypothetical protein
MKNMFRTSLVVAAVLALASVGAWAQTYLVPTGNGVMPASITMSADIGSTDALSCSASGSGYLGKFTAPLTDSAFTGSPLTVTCTVSDNESNGVSLLVYTATSGALTGVNPLNTIAGTSFWAGITGSATSTNFGSVSTYDASLTADSGVLIYNGTDTVVIPDGASGASAPFYVDFQMPHTQAADHYTGTLYVELITTT